MEMASTHRTGGWVLTLTTVTAAAALFLPLRDRPAAEPLSEWLMPGSLSPLMAMVLAAAGFWVLRRRFWPRTPHEARRLRSGAILVVIQAVFVRLAVELGHEAEKLALPWWPLDAWLWIPWFLSTGLAVMLLGSRLGVLLSVTGVFLIYLRADPGPFAIVGCLVSSLAGIVLLRRSTRFRVLRAGATAGFLLAVIAIGHGIQAASPAIAIGAAAVVPILMGVISAFAVLAVLPVMEWVLGELSDVTLVEYGSDHPLLDELREHAPGTWHHTLNVADLAEKAAAAIGARALFCRTASLYHDIGKLKAPAIFAENITGPSPHEEMDPQVSAERIIEHVTYGLELARKHRLPKPFREIIAEHHGASTLRYFYDKACAQLPEGQNPAALRALFRYPGPRPSSRESGIIALADIVEAASRSFQPKDEIEARAFVRQLIADRVTEGELADCPLTLAELAQAETTFVAWVKARNHQRPAYPKAKPSTATETEWTKNQREAQPA
ncbi:MAG: HDIG domain-containing protein [Verrucomicrobiota bacterium]